MDKAIPPNGPLRAHGAPAKSYGIPDVEAAVAARLRRPDVSNAVAEFRHGLEQARSPAILAKSASFMRVAAKANGLPVKIASEAARHLADGASPSLAAERANAPERAVRAMSDDLRTAARDGPESEAAADVAGRYVRRVLESELKTSTSPLADALELRRILEEATSWGEVLNNPKTAELAERLLGIPVPATAEGWPTMPRGHGNKATISDLAAVLGGHPGKALVAVERRNTLDAATLAEITSQGRDRNTSNR